MKNGSCLHMTHIIFDFTDLPSFFFYMLFIVLFSDKPDCGEIRASKLQAHIDWLEKNKKFIPVGGSLRQELGETPKGGLWIVNADSKDQIDTLIKTDPFFIAGLRQSYEILHWSKANAERMVLI